MNLQTKDCHYIQPDITSGTFSNICIYVAIAAEGELQFSLPKSSNFFLAMLVEFPGKIYHSLTETLKACTNIIPFLCFLHLTHTIQLLVIIA